MELQEMWALNSYQSLKKNKIIITGGFGMSLTAFNIDKPSFLVVPVNDEIKFEFTEIFYY